jgi:hypothetical protein
VVAQSLEVVMVLFTSDRENIMVHSLLGESTFYGKIKLNGFAPVARGGWASWDGACVGQVDKSLNP